MTMCTVTFVPVKDKFILTSNRDESILRTASQPVELRHNGCRLFFPRDTLAGGTWFAVNERGNAAILLNGAFQNHEKTPPYTRSRGRILLDIISAEIPASALSAIDLDNIEPFTLILFKNPELTEFRWDGGHRYNAQLDLSKNYIWSSATLYIKEVILHREKLFREFLLNTTHIDEESVIGFHNSRNNDLENGFVINRGNRLKTLSITQAVIQKDQVRLNHLDLLSNQRHAVKVPLSKNLNRCSE